MKIKIANPRAGSARYTTEYQAQRYARRGEAILIGQVLTFLSHAEQRHMQNIERQIASEGRHCSDVYVKGTIWWDGYDAGGMHRPGELVS